MFGMEKNGIILLLLLVQILGMSSSGCPPQYSEYSGHCYKVHHTGSNFTHSRRTCQNEGGDLVSMNTHEEEEYVRDLVTSMEGYNYWIGLEYVAGNYQWLDGRPVTYTHWAPGYPQCMSSPTSLCSAVYHDFFSWLDAVSINHMYFICELVPGAKNTTVEPKKGRPDSGYTVFECSFPKHPTCHEAINLECHHLGWYVTVDLTKLKRLPSDVTEIYMNEDTCTGTMQGNLLVFNQTYKECDTRAQVADGKVTFNNYIVYATRDSNNVIRDFRWKEDLHCSHDFQTSGTFNVKPNVTLQGSTSGDISGSPVDISLYTDSTFQHSLHGTVKLGTPVYVQVLSLSHPDVVMVVDSCEADITAGISHNQKPFPLIQNHCNVESTTNILAVRNQVTRFKFDMFDLSHDYDGLHVTCDVVFCDALDFSARCEQACKTGPGSSLVG